MLTSYSLHFLVTNLVKARDPAQLTDLTELLSQSEAVSQSHYQAVATNARKAAAGANILKSLFGPRQP